MKTNAKRKGGKDRESKVRELKGEKKSDTTRSPSRRKKEKKKKKGQFGSQKKKKVSCCASIQKGRKGRKLLPYFGLATEIWI